MSASAARAGVGDDEAAYYQTVEEFFVSRRGDPLFLSNADWLLVRGWRQAGTPLRVVLRGIADAFEGHALSWSRNRKVGSLAYCAREVDAARESWQHALALGEPAAGDVGALLSEAAAALESSGLGAPTAALAAALRARARAPGEPAQLEAWLHEEEQRLVAHLAAALPPEERARCAAEVDEGLRPYAGRLPEAVLAQVRSESWSRRVLERHALPRLTLCRL